MTFLKVYGGNIFEILKSCKLLKKVLIILIFFINFANSGQTQNKFFQISMNAGPTYSFLRGIHKIPFRDYEKDFKFTVGGQFNLDWAIMRRISLGIGITNHLHRLQIYDYQYELNGQTYTENPVQSVNVFSSSARGLWHFYDIYENSLETLDVYFGIQTQVIWYSTYNTSNDPNFHQYSEDIPSIPTGVAGARYFPTDWFGVYGEVAFPGAYTVAMGLSFRVGGRDKFFGRY